MEKILTVNEVAEILSVQPITVREMFREKRLRAFKVGKAWRTTETMLREDIEALARGALSNASETVPTTKEGSSTMADKKTAQKAVKPTTPVTPSKDSEPVPAADDPAVETPAPQDTSDPHWLARPREVDGEPEVTGAESPNDFDVPPVSTATKLMNQQEQISGAKQAETAIPPESERKDSTDPAAEEKKPRKKKKDADDQDLFLFDNLDS